MSDTGRYEKAATLLRIALDMQGLRLGVSLADIQTRYTDTPLSRSTAERLRNAIGDIFGDRMVRANPGETPFRWRLQRGTLGGLADLTTAELAALGTGVALMRRDGIGPQADLAGAAISKLHGLAREEARLALEVDLELLARAEGIAVRQGPRPQIDPAIVADLRQAILTCRQIRITYTYRVSGKRGWDTLRPLGFLYGARHYLVAERNDQGTWVKRNYALSNIHEVEVMPDTFQADESFSLQAYADRSFGVFQEEPFDVAWRFSPRAAADARAYHFHPTQTIEDRADGSLIVRFRAGVAQEMAWHLNTWGAAVEVLEPADFWDRVARLEQPYGEG